MDHQFNFPEHPLTNKKDPFRDEEGRNPFAGPEGQAEIPEGTSPYATSVDDDARPQPRKGDYQATLASRGAMVLWLGMVGSVCCLLGLFGLATSLFGAVEWLAGLGVVEFLSLSLLGFGFNLGAWITGQHDLRAIQAGAMQSNRVRSTRAGHLLGMSMALLTLITYITLVVTYILNMNWK